MGRRASRGGVRSAREDWAEEWRHLERAHILSQPMALPHIRTHVDMLSCALRRRDVRELTGQLFRPVVAGPGSLTGRYPVGNAGGANVSAFRPMPIPVDRRRASAGTGVWWLRFVTS